MPYTIDPKQELRHAFSARLASAIVGLTTGAKALSPGVKIRVAAALKKVAGALEKQAKSDVGLSDKKPSLTDAGVIFNLIPRAETWAIKEDVAAQLLPRKDHPEAWRISKTGGNVSATVAGPAEG